MRKLGLISGAALLLAAGQAGAATATYNVTLKLGTVLDSGTLLGEGTTTSNTAGIWSGYFFNPTTAGGAAPPELCGSSPTYLCTEFNPDPSITAVTTIDFTGTMVLVDDVNDTVTINATTQVGMDPTAALQDRKRSQANPSLGGAVGNTLTNWSKTAAWDPLAEDPPLFGAVAVANVDLGLGTVAAEGGYSVDTGNQSCLGAPLISVICTSINTANSTLSEQWSSGLDSTGAKNATQLYDIANSPGGGNGKTDISCTTSGDTISCTGHYVIVSSTAQGTSATADVVMKVPLTGFCKTGSKICTTTGSATIGTFTLTGTVVPAPAGIWLLGTGLAGLAFRARRRFAA